MIRGRSVLLLVAVGVAAGLLAYLVYFWWPSPLLDGTRIESFAYGPVGANIREFEMHERGTEGAFLDDVITLANQAPLSGTPVETFDGDVLLVLFRDDGLQFHLTYRDGDQVGISEGDGSYRGALRSPGLADLLAGLNIAEGQGGG